MRWVRGTFYFASSFPFFLGMRKKCNVTIMHAFVPASFLSVVFPHAHAHENHVAAYGDVRDTEKYV